MSVAAASQYPVPANGLSLADFGRRRTAAAAQTVGAQASLAAGGSLGDIGSAQASASVAANAGTKAPLAGFVVGMAVLVAIRVAWELAEDMD